MILSEPHGFLFVANLRTGSSSIHQALKPVASVAFDDTGGGKHLSLAEISRRFGAQRISRLYKWAVARDPLEYLWSLYAFHKHPGFDGSPLSTKGRTFEEFYRARAELWMPMPQAARFVDPAGAYGLDLLIRFEHLREGFSYLKLRLGLPNLLLPSLNASQPSPPRIPPDLAEHIRDDYAVDYDCIARYGDRERSPGGFALVLRPTAPSVEAR
jgi:hypothetical protein